MNFYTAFICNKGHVASSYGEYTTRFCTKCGSEIISKCPECNSPIPGKINEDGIVFTAKYSLPYYCGYCGKPYPWTNDFINKGIELISLDAELDEETKSLLKDSLPDLIVETPGATALATARYAKFLPKLSEFVQDGLKQIIFDFATETVRKTLFHLPD